MAPAKRIAATASAVTTAAAGSVAAGYLFGRYATAAVLDGAGFLRHTAGKDAR